MKKKNLFTGSIFQFYVPEIRKYAFCKFFDFTHISPFHGLLAQVFDYFSDDEISKINELKSIDWLFGPRSIHKWPSLRKGTGWKYLGILTGTTDDTIPDFKGVQALHSVVEDESKIGPWYPIHNFNQRGKDSEYKQVQHLERIILTTTSHSLVWRTGMEFCRTNGLKVEDYYNITEEGIRQMYWQMKNVPIYRTIPKELRGRALVNV